MNNKLGISDYRLNIVEKKLVQFKIELLDIDFNFNSSEINFEFLKSLNYYLFSEIYYDEDLGTRNLKIEQKNQINDYMKKIISICIISPNNIDQILEIIKSIWYLQPFHIGNTRTLIAYLKFINECFLLDLNIDLYKDIESKPSIFNKENFVNQKRLTKIK